MNIANKLSLTRIVLTFIFVVCLFGSTLFWRAAALLFFTLAVITDIYDGRIARAKNIITPLGMLLDPLADKILISAAFITFVGIEEIWVPAWMVVIIITREFFIMGLRLLASGQGIILPAEREGKNKTIAQMGTVVIILLYLTARAPLQSAGILNENAEVWARGGIYILMCITLIFTISSGYFYLKKHRDMFMK